jgi:hypothetical protein
LIVEINGFFVPAGIGEIVAAARAYRRTEGLVLPDRIELSTSPLPMECSTTELRQRTPDVKSQNRTVYVNQLKSL